MSSNAAPLEIGRVTLTVRDLAATGAFYENVIGLEQLEADTTQAIYGVGGRPLVELRGDPAARPASRQDAGLFHTAFLLPSRADLGAWLGYAAASDVQLHGASDHLVSEALYLADPEGNGIEIYADRPRSSWQHQGTEVVMATERLNLRDLAASAKAPWGGAPDGTVVGHVHLQAGDLVAAEGFYADKLGFPVTCRYPGAVFFGSGGYHHHLAANVWNSRGAQVRDEGVAGLAAVEILGVPEEIAGLRQRAGAEARDPWGTRFVFRGKDTADAG